VIVSGSDVSNIVPNGCYRSAVRSIAVLFAVAKENRHRLEGRGNHCLFLEDDWRYHSCDHRSISAFPRIAEMLYLFVFTQFRTLNRCAGIAPQRVA
jgi:hypothetical protein